MEVDANLQLNRKKLRKPTSEPELESKLTDMLMLVVSSTSGLIIIFTAPSSMYNA